jgi:hypothetical protein
MTDTHIASQPSHVPGAEHVLYQTVVFAQVKLSVITSHDARRILTPMLQYG